MNRPKIGLALGSGAMRGLAHIGVIQILEDNNIPIDYIAGSSIGAVIGALYCSGTDFKYICKILEYINIKDLIDIGFSRKGIIKGKKIEEYLKVLVKTNDFSKLKIPLKIIATDIKSGEKVIFDSGNVIDAVRASIGIPGIFSPLKIGDKLLVDGGLSERLPSQTSKQMGADIVIGVDVGYKLGDNYEPNTLIDIIFQSIGIMESKCLNDSYNACDILISPNLANKNPYSLESAMDIIEEGKKSMLEKLDELKKIIMKNKICSIKATIEQKVSINI